MLLSVRASSGSFVLASAFWDEILPVAAEDIDFLTPGRAASCQVLFLLLTVYVGMTGSSRTIFRIFLQFRLILDIDDTLRRTDGG
jgi:hypothetical protein